MQTPAAGATAPAPPLIDTHFELTTLDGRDVTDADYRGKWLLVYFGYTFCPDICPTTLTDVGAALASLGNAADKFQPVFITLDPARDSVKVMTDYLKAFSPRFVGLRADGATIAETAHRFHVYYRMQSLGNGEYAIDHSSYVYVIDPQGKFVQLLSPDTPGHSMADALRKLHD
ncbi:MAG: SCO family protein [Rhizomicrobium sp.]